MSRSFGTALFAVALAGSSLATAEAKTPVVAPIVASASHRDADRRLEEPTVTATSTFTIPARMRSALRVDETISTMPRANADLAMWSVAVATPPAARARKIALLASLTRKQDAIHRFARGIISRTSSIAMSLTRSAMRFIGTPYVFGGTSPSGFDCSGYTQHVFAMLGIALPRTADAQYYAGRPTVGGMTTGDLVFFQTYLPGPSHVGIYLGNGRFVHSSSHGVMVSRLSDSYWRSRYIGAKRLATLN